MKEYVPPSYCCVLHRLETVVLAFPGTVLEPPGPSNGYATYCRACWVDRDIERTRAEIARLEKELTRLAIEKSMHACYVK